MAELLTVVATVGIVALAAFPAFMQLIPQYRMRGVAAEIAATMRMARAQAIGTRTPWRVTFDGANNRYAISRLSTPVTTDTYALLQQPGNWVKINENGRKVTTDNGIWWKYIRVKDMDLRTSTTNPFRDVDCNSGVDVIFLRDGTVYDGYNSTCGATSTLTFTTLPSVQLYFNSSFLRYNRYYIQVEESGNVKVVAAKE
jgi:Tfp pilus assembly protein PilE